MAQISIGHIFITTALTVKVQDYKDFTGCEDSTIHRTWTQGFDRKDLCQEEPILPQRFQVVGPDDITLAERLLQKAYIF